MGTSVSHPSPLTAEWSNLKSSIKFGYERNRIFDNTIRAFKFEYGESYQDIIVDRGVKLIIKSLKTIVKQTNKKINIGAFISTTREELSRQNCNSFFSELSIVAATESLLKEDNLLKDFSIFYSLKIFDYILSRDLPSLLGTIGVTNLISIENLLNEIKEVIENRLTKESKNPEEMLKTILSDEGILNA